MKTGNIKKHNSVIFCAYLCSFMCQKHPKAFPFPALPFRLQVVQSRAALLPYPVDGGQIANTHTHIPEESPGANAEKARNPAMILFNIADISIPSLYRYWLAILDI
jgi:hypothetical protein